MRTLAFVVRRLLLVALVMLVVSVLIFGIVQWLPGDVAVMILGTSATPQDLAALRVKLGLDRPTLVRYVDWITGALRGEWGTSLLYQVPVRPLVVERVRQSAVLAVLALGVAVPLSIGLGVLSALRRGQFAGITAASHCGGASAHHCRHRVCRFGHERLGSSACRSLPPNPDASQHPGSTGPV